MATEISEATERRMHLEALERDTPRVWRTLPARYKVDKAFVLTALKSERLPHKSDFERQFPQSLRFDRDVVLAYTARPDFKQMYYDRHLFVPDCLTSDKEVMLAYCRQIPRSLQECSAELCDDRDVVMAALSLEGLELQYASVRLQEDEDVIKAACESNGQALELCPKGPVRDKLIKNREFILKVLQKHGGPMLRLVAEPLRKDRELLLEALKHGMKFRYCPFQFQNDKEFVEEVLRLRSSLFLEMNRTTQGQLDLARVAMVSETSTPQVHDRALELHPTLTSFRDVALSLAHRADPRKLPDYLIDGMPSYKADREVMLVAVGRNQKLFSRVAAELQRELDIILAAIAPDTALSVLSTVGQERQTQNPEITVKAIELANLSGLRLFQPVVPNALWTNFDVAVAWMKRLHRIPTGASSLLTNRNFCMEVARYAHTSFSSVSSTLRGDFEFMKEAVDINGLVLRWGAQPLRGNMELVVRAVASSSRHALSPQISITQERLRAHLETKLQSHKSFLYEFLRGIAVPTPHLPPARRSQLPLLDRGVETSQAFKELIAQFVGVPLGEELSLLRRAKERLDAPDPPANDPFEAERPAVVRLRRLRQQRMQLRRAGQPAAAAGGGGAAVRGAAVGRGDVMDRLLAMDQNDALLFAPAQNQAALQVQPPQPAVGAARPARAGPFFGFPPAAAAAPQQNPGRFFGFPPAAAAAPQPNPGRLFGFRPAVAAAPQQNPPMAAPAVAENPFAMALERPAGEADIRYDAGEAARRRREQMRATMRRQRGLFGAPRLGNNGNEEAARGHDRGVASRVRFGFVGDAQPQERPRNGEGIQGDEQPLRRDIPQRQQGEIETHQAQLQAARQAQLQAEQAAHRAHGQAQHHARLQPQATRQARFRAVVRQAQLRHEQAARQAQLQAEQALQQARQEALENIQMLEAEDMELRFIAMFDDEEFL